MTALDLPEATATKEIQLATFQCGELLVGINLDDVQEITRESGFTDVPESPQYIRGVINLRGEVITMVDLRVILNQPHGADHAATHNVFVRSDDEVIGLATDGVSDIVTLSEETIDPTPATLKETDTPIFRGVHTTSDNKFIVILDLTNVLAHAS